MLQRSIALAILLPLITVAHSAWARTADAVSENAAPLPQATQLALNPQPLPPKWQSLRSRELHNPKLRILNPQPFPPRPVTR